MHHTALEFYEAHKHAHAKNLNTLTERAIIGVDEVGRGALFGDVVVAACALDAPWFVDSGKDSKRLTPLGRLKECNALAGAPFVLVSASAQTIDARNILNATLDAMGCAVNLLLKRHPHIHPCILIDGDKTPPIQHGTAYAVIKGDTRHPAISAASILAKVYRDGMMEAWDKVHPGYGFAKHKGYPSAGHIKALEQLGALDGHRKSFAPVARVLNQAPAWVQGSLF